MRNGAVTNWKLLKQRKCFTSQYIADRLGIHQSTVDAWFRGTTLPHHNHMLALCDVFDIDQTTACKLFEADAKGVLLDLDALLNDNVTVVSTDTKPTSTTTVSDPEQSSDGILKSLLCDFLDAGINADSIYSFLTMYKENPTELFVVMANLYGKISAVDYVGIFRIVNSYAK